MSKLKSEIRLAEKRVDTRARADAIAISSALKPSPKRSESFYPPPELSPQCLQGLAGDIVRMIEPHTEGPPAALLVQLLVGFGIALDKTAYFSVSRTRHHTKLFAVLVGDTAKGRKGTSWNEIEYLLTLIDDSFSKCVVNGLSSGEGLIHHVRDPITRPMPVKKKGRIVEYQDEIVDEGSAEKRALVIEAEFGKTLKVMSRDGNTLSAVIREAWDKDNLRIMTRTPLRASDCHIGIIGHITKMELVKCLDDGDRANGFANRFLWVYVCKSKYLPFPTIVPDSKIDDAALQLRDSLEFGRSTREIRRDGNADKLWQKNYKRLADGYPGLIGSVTSRAEAQVMRLATIYAILDRSRTIRVEHLSAALALWDYCDDSAKYIFGMSFGTRLADLIFRLLRDKGPLSRTDINNNLGRNYTSKHINEALEALTELDRIESTTKRPFRGRPKEMFRVSEIPENLANKGAELDWDFDDDEKDQDQDDLWTW